MFLKLEQELTFCNMMEIMPILNLFFKYIYILVTVFLFMCKEKKKKETLNHLEIEKVNW